MTLLELAVFVQNRGRYPGFNSPYLGTLPYHDTSASVGFCRVLEPAAPLVIEGARRGDDARTREAVPEGMVVVPGGPFFMGCNEKVDQECYDDEKPGRTVEVGTFYIDKHEVTSTEYAECVRARRCSEPDTRAGCTFGQSNLGRHPINCVDWHQAVAFCAWKNKRLPSEKEWEKAARGTDGRKYPWGNDGFGRKKVANISKVDGYDDGFSGTAPVGSFPDGASPSGALDMIGNIWEWVEDWYEKDKYRSVRGGSWGNHPRDARASNRSRHAPGDRNDHVGFRCAQSANSDP